MLEEKKGGAFDPKEGALVGLLLKGGELEAVVSESETAANKFFEIFGLFSPKQSVAWNLEQRNGFQLGKGDEATSVTNIENG